ncbi:MAG: vanadium-dependent haloperoxidase [Betaproteobacteria bacterium]|nr:vanadium-dependent haloperoxidase [Betaproteobacteria bacterium]
MSNHERACPASTPISHNWARSFCALLLINLIGCTTLVPTPPSPTTLATHNTLIYWQDEALALIKKYQTNAVRASRVLAYLHQGIDQTLMGEPLTACHDQAIAQVSAELLNHFFPQETPGRLHAKALLQTRAEEVAACERARVQALAVAQNTIAIALQDGVYPPRRIRVNPAPRLGSWQPTPPTNSLNPTEPYAGEWRPLALDNMARIRLAPPPAADTAPYREAIEEIIALRKTLTPEQKKQAESWHLEAGSVTPAGVWNLKLRDWLRQTAEAGSTPSQTARFLAALNTAMYDAFIACWHGRYTHWVERPYTAAQRIGATDFQPWLITPSFPGYPSGLACTSGAAASVVGAYLPAHTAAVNTWAKEAATSRLYGGVHFRFDIEAGLDLGRQVGGIVIEKRPPQ